MNNDNSSVQEKGAHLGPRDTDRLFRLALAKLCPSDYGFEPLKQGVGYMFGELRRQMVGISVDDKAVPLDGTAAAAAD